MPNPKHFKLETTFQGDSITHVTYITDLHAGLRKAPVETTWTSKKILGSGGYGTVFLQEAEGGHQLRAVKRVEKKKTLRGIDVELKVMSKVVHCRALFVILDGWYENDDFYFIAMEYIQGGDLTQYIKEAGPVSCAENARDITRQLLEGLDVLHGMLICHRDLKPQNVLIACVDPIWVKIADFGISKRFKDTVLKTHAGSHAYMAPELLGLLPRELMDTTYTKAVDIWSLGCLVHEVLTTEIPFLEMISADSTGIEQEDSGLQRTDFTSFKSFCDGKTELPLDSLRRSGASDTAVQFLKTLLVADPKCRPPAKEALLSKWLPRGADTRSLAGDRAAAPVRRVAEGMIATPTTASAINRRPGQNLESATSGFQSRMPPHTHPPTRDLGNTAKLVRTNSIEYRPLPGMLGEFRSELRIAGHEKRESRVRWALRLSYPYTYMAIHLGTNASIEGVVNAGMLTLRDAVENQYPQGLTLIAKSWTSVLVKIVRNGRASLLESELKICAQDLSSLIRDGWIDDARNLIIAALELFIEVCRAGDRDLIEIVGGVWAKTLDDWFIGTFGDEILLLLPTYCERWVTAVKGRDITETKLLMQAGNELFLAIGRAEGQWLQREFAPLCLQSVQQVLNDPDMQDWLLKKLKSKSITSFDIGAQDEEFAKLIVGIGLEFFLAIALSNQGRRYKRLRVNLLSSSTIILKKIVLAGHLQSVKTVVENIVEKKFTELAGGASDQLRNELEANLLEILQAVSVATPELHSTVENLKSRIKIFRVMFSAEQAEQVEQTEQTEQTDEETEQTDEQTDEQNEETEETDEETEQAMQTISYNPIPHRVSAI